MATKLDAGQPLAWNSPAWDGEAVNIASADFTPTAARGTVGRGIYVGGAGDVTLILAGGGTVTFKAVPVGTTINACWGTVVRATTTATLMVALY